MKLNGPLCALAAALLLGACASTRAPADPADPFTRSAEDVGLVRAEPPEALTRALAHPYAPPAGCAALLGELAELNVVLGPDVDDADEAPADAVLDDLVGALIPYRGIVRQVSGAARRERELARAVMAGVARRGFLKGQARGLGCALPARSAAD